jgi:2'-5' RNA ligase
MARAFVAVRLPEAVLDAVDDVAPAVAGARYTSRAQRHLTLQFLGNRVDVDAVAGALRAIAVARGEVQLGGGGAFPSARRARLLWVGVATGGPFLAQLSAAVGALLVPLGHEPEAREYHPHVTLARWKTPTDARPAIASIGDRLVGDAFTVDEIVLYESRLHRDGAQYTPRAVVSIA